MDYYESIKEKLIDNEIYSRVKDYSKERNRLTTYYEVGRLLSEAGKHYGEGIIKTYSQKLTQELGKGYTPTRLKYYRRFYIVFSKSPTLSDKLSFSHYCEIIWFDNNKMEYYIKLIENKKLTIRELRNRIKSKEYERLPEETKVKLVNKEEKSIIDLVPNPIIIRNPNNIEVISEKILQRLILENITLFLEELGDGFTFIKNEYKIKIGKSYNYIDILLFNYEYNCFVAVELKVTSLKKEYIGQIEIYMNYIDKNVKKITHDKTIGLIVSKEDNQYIVEYSSDRRIMSRYYEIK